MPKVLITGGSGLIGSKLSTLLRDRGTDVVHVSRNVTGKEEFKTYEWDVKNQTMDSKALDGVESIIHLAGAPIAEEKWTAERKKEILDSRVSSAKLLLDTCQANNIKLEHFISASAIGWYPQVISDTIYDESAEVASGFLGDVCKAWEASADNMQQVSKRVSKVRIGLVLSRYGGALKQIERPIKFYAGAALGTGKQQVPWIHRFDVANIFCYLLDHRLAGVYNAVGPEFCDIKNFMQTVADIIDRPIMLPNMPEFLIRLLFGDSAELVLYGPKISCEKILSEGFQFEFPTMTSALFNIYWSPQAATPSV